MATPRIPNGFKPVASGFRYAAPEGVFMSETGGGTPRVARAWDRGLMTVDLTFVHDLEKHSILEAWFRHVIKGGAVMFYCPMDTGFGFKDHLCWMVAGTYQAGRIGSNPIWSATCTVMTEPGAYEMTEADAINMIALWEDQGIDYELLAALARLATVSTAGWAQL